MFRAEGGHQRLGLQRLHPVYWWQRSVSLTDLIDCYHDVMCYQIFAIVYFLIYFSLYFSLFVLSASLVASPQGGQRKCLLSKRLLTSIHTSISCKRYTNIIWDDLINDQREWRMKTTKMVLWIFLNSMETVCLSLPLPLLGRCFLLDQRRSYCSLCPHSSVWSVSRWRWAGTRLCQLVCPLSGGLTLTQQAHFLSGQCLPHITPPPPPPTHSEKFYPQWKGCQYYCLAVMGYWGWICSPHQLSAIFVQVQSRPKGSVSQLL